MSYRHIPCEWPWFTDKAVFGRGGFPWNCSDYRGERDPSYPMTNAIRVTDTNFNIGVHENYTQREIADILGAIEKVERAYLR